MPVKIGLLILAPSRISNSPAIQKSYERYRKGFPRRSFRLRATEMQFESFHQKSFYVVHELNAF